MAEMAPNQARPTATAKSDGCLSESEPNLTPDATASVDSLPLKNEGAEEEEEMERDASTIEPAASPSKTSSRFISRNPSFSWSSSHNEDWESLPPPDRMGVMDLLDNFALPQQLEKLQRSLSAQRDKVRKSRDALKSKSQVARERMVEEWRRRVPSADEQLERYRSSMKKNVEKLGRQWNDTTAITFREKISFICGVMNILISGYLIGGYPHLYHYWYTAQLLYFMPIRFFSYRRCGYHYFLADLCYFVNFLLFLSIWVFPSSKRLFLATFCLAFGNNAVAIVMWRNSLVFHSFDKVTSLFIHIMPCATLHCILHLITSEQQKEMFPSIWAIKNTPTAYTNIVSMLTWSTLPYLIWQLLYYVLITVRRREKIAAGRPTSFTWMRQSYSKTWIGKLVLSLPESFQEAAFMLIQYLYAVFTMLPCPVWFYSRWASGGFLLVVFMWSVYNGSTYYIDVFGKRFQKELESMKAEVAKWQNSPDLMMMNHHQQQQGESPVMTPMPESGNHNSTMATTDGNRTSALDAEKVGSAGDRERSTSSLNQIPLLGEEGRKGRDGADAAAAVVDSGKLGTTATARDTGAGTAPRERRTGVSGGDEES